MSNIDNASRHTINLLGVNIDVLDTDGLCNKIIELASLDSSHAITYVNADCMLLARDDEKYRWVLNNCDLVYADGVGVVYGARLWGWHLPGRSTAADFMPDFCRKFSQKCLRLYFLGASDGVVEEAAARLRRKIPDLKIVGTHHGYFTSEQEQEIIAEINNSTPDIVVVGLGAPRQELWISENVDKINTAVIWGVGGLFDFLSGRTKRGPQWMLDNGFEWLCRLITEPRRLWRRYLIGNTKYVMYLIWCRFFKRNSASP